MSDFRDEWPLHPACRCGQHRGCPRGIHDLLPAEYDPWDHSVDRVCDCQPRCTWGLLHCPRCLWESVVLASEDGEWRCRVCEARFTSDEVGATYKRMENVIPNERYL